ncbi:S8 family serine peptidase [Halomarina litorea]|uniref:S8 family serine peptidase n=1 Tax=Halomarina litorea TaxID=2961595 RepID=UPI0020C4CF65|nr:S8 family serine peptidase [Halomarina sp. BCD28]
MDYPRRVLTVALVCALLVVPPVPLSTDGGDHAVSDVDIVDALRERLDRQRADPPTVDAQVRVVLKLQSHDTTVPRAEGFEVERVYTEHGERLVEGSVSMAQVHRLSEDPRIQGVRISSGDRTGDGRVAAGVAVVGADRLHAANVTGENVTVGIIDADFRMSHPAIASSATYYRQFGDVAPDEWHHGTAVASVVADTAPDADLHLAAIGSSTTPEEYREAVQFLLDNGADVVVDAGSYYSQPGDGSGELAQVAAEAATETVFVTSAGNHGQSYWAGNYTGGEYVDVTETTEGNVLNGGEAFSGRVRVTVRWEGWPETDSNYDVYLLRNTSGKDIVVAKATGHDGRPVEYLDTTVREGEYYVAVRAVDGTPGERIEVFASHDLTHRSTGGSSAPATAEGVLAVGASQNGTVEAFSARGGVDLVAPDDVAAEGVSVDGGTSFAAPYVAGVAALVVSEHPEYSPDDVRTRLLATAVDVGPTGLDDASGYGRVNATGAVSGPLPAGGDPAPPGPEEAG